MKKYIFLDIDGVLANLENSDGRLGLSSTCQANLGKILEETNAAIIIVSSWREPSFLDTRTKMKMAGFLYTKRILGVTIRAHDHLKGKVHLSIPRGVEVKQYLDTHVHSDNGKNFRKRTVGVDYNYVILDDSDAYLIEQSDHLIQVDPSIGLSEENALKAIKILNEWKTLEDFN